MLNKITQGTWKLLPGHHEHHIYIDHPDKAKETISLALVIRHALISAAEREANARLIAAAPALLAFVQNVQLERYTSAPQAAMAAQELLDALEVKPGYNPQTLIQRSHHLETVAPENVGVGDTILDPANRHVTVTSTWHWSKQGIVLVRWWDETKTVEYNEAHNEAKYRYGQAVFKVVYDLTTEDKAHIARTVKEVAILTEQLKEDRRQAAVMAREQQAVDALKKRAAEIKEWEESHYIDPRDDHPNPAVS